MEAMDQLTYTSDPIPESIRDAAGDAAAQCGYDQFEEVLLDYEIVGIRRVSAQSVKDHYGAWLSRLVPFHPMRSCVSTGKPGLCQSASTTPMRRL